MTIGNDVFINYGSSVGCAERIEIGNRVNIGPFVMIIDSGFHDLYERDKRPPFSLIRRVSVERAPALAGHRIGWPGYEA